MQFLLFLVFNIHLLIVNGSGVYHQSNFDTSVDDNVTLHKHYTHESHHHRTLRQIDCFGRGKEFANIVEKVVYGRKNNHTADELNIRFYFITRDQRERRREFVLGRELNLTEVDFKVKRRTVLIVHGFLSSAEKSWVKDMESAYLLWNDANVILVDWSEYAGEKNYYHAVVHTKIVCRAILKVLNEIVNITTTLSADKSINWGPIHMIGHSLGAQICGMAAKEYGKSSTPWKVTRLTALDPARPCFERPEINKNVAPFVDVIHTNGRDEKQSLGLAGPIGHMDFYPNGGQEQLGCSSMQKSLKVAGFFGLPAKSVNKALCSHKRAQNYFTESLIEAHYKNGSFFGHHWNRSYEDALRIIDESCEKNKCPEMGINAENYPERGSFFVKVSETLPYSVIKPTDVVEIKKLIEKELGIPSLAPNIFHSYTFIIVSIIMYVSIFESCLYYS